MIKRERERARIGSEMGNLISLEGNVTWSVPCELHLGIFRSRWRWWSSTFLHFGRTIHSHVLWLTSQPNSSRRRLFECLWQNCTGHLYRTALPLLPGDTLYLSQWAQAFFCILITHSSSTPAEWPVLSETLTWGSRLSSNPSINNHLKETRTRKTRSLFNG